MAVDIERALEAVADPVRRRIVDRLAGGPLPVGRLAEGMPVGRPAISMHLRLLRSAGVVRVEPVGNRRLYRLEPEAMRLLRDYFDDHWAQALTAFREAAEAEVRREGRDGDGPGRD